MSMDTEAIWQAIGAYGNARWRGMSHEIDAADHLSEIKRLLNEADVEHKAVLDENERLVDELQAARKEISEQARLNAMGAEREARLIAERDAAVKEGERLNDEVKSLRKDAERFRFADQSPSDFAICYWHEEPGESGDWWCQGPRGDSITLLDKAIAESKRAA